MASKRCKPVIGLLGGIGSGKSLVAHQFQSLGCGIIDADRLARRASEQPKILAGIRQRWGDVVVSRTGVLDRQALARLVFSDPRSLDDLEQLLHPPILHMRKRQHARFQADSAILAIVEDTPLLMEKGLDAECDQLVFVDAPFEIRLERVKARRGWSEQQMHLREEKQLSLDIKAKRADHMIVNSAGEGDCLAHVRRVLSKIIQNWR